MTQFETEIELHKPIKRGRQEFHTLQLWWPRVDDLKGCNLAGLMRMEADDVRAVLMSISRPKLTKRDVRGLDVRDFAQAAIFISRALLDGSPEMQAAEADEKEQQENTNG